MGTGLLTLANEAYGNSPEDLRAVPFKYHYKVELCPHKPGALDLMLKWRQEVLDTFADLDLEYIRFRPYDQGGCMCEDCTPWGANGYLEVAEPVARLVRRTCPRAKTVLSTWCFDYETPGEYEGLWRFLADRPDWADYLMVDAHDDFPRHAIDHGPPGGLPLLNFTEISMHGMSPWGGFGANPQPHTFQGRWDASHHLLSGGFPYSEGIYEDINKAILFQFYWDAHRSAVETVREYAAYEYAPEVADDVTRAVELMEACQQHRLEPDAEVRKSHPYSLAKVEESERYLDILQTVEARLPERARASWRWRVLWLRAALDVAIHRSGGAPTDETEGYLAELIALYHAENAEPVVHPPSQSFLEQHRAS